MNDFDNEKATAVYSGLSRALLRKRRLLGLAPSYVKVGRKVLYARREIHRFLAECTVSPSPEPDQEAPSLPSEVVQSPR